MEKFVPYEKLSKKKKKEFNSKRRKSWGNIHPATKKVEKYYKRRKEELRGVE